MTNVVFMQTIIFEMLGKLSIMLSTQCSSFFIRLKPGEQPLRKKGRGRLIHVSDFINEEDGRLTSKDSNGTILKDARKIIYPGASGDSWWMHENLLEQVKLAMEIHEEVNGPECQALFIFDNSSAHASLPPDALRAFNMNKSVIVLLPNINQKYHLGVPKNWRAKNVVGKTSEQCF